MRKWGHMLKNSIKFIPLLFLYSCASTSVVKDNPNVYESVGETTALSWFKEHSDNPKWSVEGKEIAKELYYELGPNKLAFAVRALNKIPFKKLTFKEAKSFNNHFEIKPNKQPYLVRGLVANSTGEYRLKLQKGNILEIHHESLGGNSTPRFSPLIINLSNEPKELILGVSTAI